MPSKIEFDTGDGTVEFPPYDTNNSPSDHFTGVRIRQLDDNSWYLPLVDPANSPDDEIRVQTQDGVKSPVQYFQLMGLIVEDFAGGDLDSSNRDDWVTTPPSPNNNNLYVVGSDSGPYFGPDTKLPTRIQASFSQSSGSVIKQNSNDRLELNDDGSGITATMSWSSPNNYTPGIFDYAEDYTRYYLSSEPSGGSISFTYSGSSNSITSEINYSDSVLYGYHNGSQIYSSTTLYDSLNFGSWERLNHRINAGGDDYYVRTRSEFGGEFVSSGLNEIEGSMSAEVQVSNVDTSQILFDTKNLSG